MRIKREALDRINEFGFLVALLFLFHSSPSHAHSVQFSLDSGLNYSTETSLLRNINPFIGGTLSWRYKEVLDLGLFFQAESVELHPVDEAQRSTRLDFYGFSSRLRGAHFGDCNLFLDFQLGRSHSFGSGWGYAAGGSYEINLSQEIGLRFVVHSRKVDAVYDIGHLNFRAAEIGVSLFVQL